MRIKRSSSLTEQEKHQLLSWGDDIFHTEELELMWRPKESHLILYIGDRPVTHCGLITQSINVGDSSFLVGGVGGVVTAPDFQGRGYAHQILQEALTIFALEERPAALLFCREALQPFYHQQNWQLIPDPVWILQSSGLVQFPACTMVHTLNGFSWPDGPLKIDSLPW